MEQYGLDITKYSYFSKNDDHMMEYSEDLLNELQKFIDSLN